MDLIKAYPLTLKGELDPVQSRWLWLVKWLLLIPHFIILVVLWAAFFMVCLIAFFAILFTRQFPKSLFEFNVGVLRWSWRVGFYSYLALGTDRYPPFSLQSEDYPADLEVDYPAELSRGLVLVKWWLLAFPQYVVTAFFNWGLGPRSGGLILILVLFAGIKLLFTGEHHRDIFNFVMKMNRWCFRVGAYASLMTDEYPPFRLD